jgi:hypothetical protein
LSTIAVLFGRPHRAPDADDRFELEALAAEEVGLESYATPLDPVVNGDAERALRRLPRPRHRRWLYRGWMLSEEEYTSLHEAVADRGEELVVDPESFAEATYAPSYLPLLGEHTPPARWTEGESIEEAWEVAQELGPPPWVVKDHVKSAKEEWYRACFVPEGAAYGDFAAVCDRLLELRGDRFERGFVVKKYVALATLPGWTAEQRRVPDEHRLVFAVLHRRRGPAGRRRVHGGRDQRRRVLGPAGADGPTRPLSRLAVTSGLDVASVLKARAPK